MNICQADVMAIPYASGTFQAVCFSPPYWGLRAYQTGDNKHLELGSEKLHDCLGWATGQRCGECFVCHTVSYMREVRRVLRDDGVCWLNVGDSYAGSWGNNGAREGKQRTQSAERLPRVAYDEYTERPPTAYNLPGLKPKDLCLIPERLALALQADGWWVRAPIIWHKPNPMPGSQQDRPTIDFEFVWMLTKKAHYYFDMEAVREDSIYPDDNRKARSKEGQKRIPNGIINGIAPGDATYPTRSMRAVWTIPTQPYSGAKRTCQARRVALDAVFDGMRCITLPDCPIHGGQFAQVAREFCGEREGDLMNRTIDTYNHLFRVRHGDCVPTHQKSGGSHMGDNLDAVLQVYSPLAIDHNSETHRMALALGSSAAYIPFFEKADRIGDKLELLASFVQHLCIFGNNILPGDCSARLLEGTPHRIVGISLGQVPLTSVTSECKCLFYKNYTTISDHYATFPEELALKCLKASTSERGACPKCGKAWKRILERDSDYKDIDEEYGGKQLAMDKQHSGRRILLNMKRMREQGRDHDNPFPVKTTLGWQPQCKCGISETRPCRIYDPFIGSGTTIVAARRLGLDAYGSDLSLQYLAENARERIANDAPRF